MLYPLSYKHKTHQSDPYPAMTSGAPLAIDLNLL